jgi:phosphate transport system permease protein
MDIKINYRPVWDLKTKKFYISSHFFTALTAICGLIILFILFLILSHIFINGFKHISWRFLTTIPQTDFFNVETTGILPHIVGTTLKVFIMTIFGVPVGVITAIYLSEYSSNTSKTTRIIRSAVNNLAGVPSIVFGLFGLGFFINFIGQNIDELMKYQEPVWGKPALIWASLTLAVMTLPVVIVSTEEAIRATPPGEREASYALGATKLQTIFNIILPRAFPGILTGTILAVSRAAGEVAPILFTGVAYFMADLPHKLTDQFLDLGFHVFVLSTQSPNIEKTKPILYATVAVLVVLTFTLNLAAIFIRARIRRKQRASE